MAKTPTAVDLPMVDPLPKPTQKYFDVCTDMRADDGNHAQAR